MKVGSKVFLINDSKKEPYTIVKKLGISRGPVGQFNPSRIYEVLDTRKRIWQFREDSLQVIKK